MGKVITEIIKMRHFGPNVTAFFIPVRFTDTSMITLVEVITSTPETIAVKNGEDKKKKKSKKKQKLQHLPVAKKASLSLRHPRERP